VTSYYQPGAPQYPPPPPGYQQYRNGFGTASLVLGIIAIICGGFLSIVGLGLGFAGLSRAKHGRADNRGTALWGTWLSGIALVGWIIIWAVVAANANNSINTYNRQQQIIQQQLQQDLNDLSSAAAQIPTDFPT
jgi:Domain of unknown function (DUF4190)